MPLYSPPCWRVSQLQRWAWERVSCEKLLQCWRLLGRARRFGAHGGRDGRGHIVAAARLQHATLHAKLRSVLKSPLYVCVFVGPPYYSQRAVFASPLSAFYFLVLNSERILILKLTSKSVANCAHIINVERIALTK